LGLTWGALKTCEPDRIYIMRLAEALDQFKPAGPGDVAMILAFTGLRWEEAVAVPIENVDLDGQWINVDRTASESGGTPEYPSRPKDPGRRTSRRHSRRRLSRASRLTQAERPPGIGLPGSHAIGDRPWLYKP
jgi:integrase